MISIYSIKRNALWQGKKLEGGEGRKKLEKKEHPKTKKGIEKKG